MARKKIKINRAPVLTLWAAVVAERLGYDHDAALTLGKSVAGLNAQSKGQRLGFYEKPTDESADTEAKKRQAPTHMSKPILGRAVPIVKTPQGVRATAAGKPLEPGSVQRYLQQKFGADLAETQAVMEKLAKAYHPDDLTKNAYALYEKFRPTIPEGVRGWGAKGELNLNVIEKLAK